MSYGNTGHLGIVGCRGGVAWSSGHHRNLPLQGSRVHFPVSLPFSCKNVVTATMAMLVTRKTYGEKSQQKVFAGRVRGPHLNEGGSSDERERDWQANVEWIQERKNEVRLEIDSMVKRLVWLDMVRKNERLRHLLCRNNTTKL